MPTSPTAAALDLSFISTLKHGLPALQRDLPCACLCSLPVCYRPWGSPKPPPRLPQGDSNSGAHQGLSTCL
jgi:hypothetical protein